MALTLADLVVATYNIKFTVGLQNAIADVNELINDHGAQIIGLQEFGAPERADFDRHFAGWNGYQPEPTVAMGTTPILFDRNVFDIVGAGGKRATPETYVGDAGAGPATLKAKWVNWVKLRHLPSGRYIVVFNNHAVPTAQDRQTGCPTDDPDLQERVDLHREHMGLLKRMIDDWDPDGLVFTIGDFNIDYATDVACQHPDFPYAKLHEANTVSSWEALGMTSHGTFLDDQGHRWLDWVCHRQDPAVTPADHVPLYYGHSDHRGVVVRYNIT